MTKAILGLLLLCGLANSAQAYVGPGVGLGAIGVLLGVVGGVLLAIFGLFWYPIKRMLKQSAGEPDIVLMSEDELASTQASESSIDENRQREKQTSSEQS